MRENATVSGEWCGVEGQRLAQRRMAWLMGTLFEAGIGRQDQPLQMGRERPDDDPHAR